MNGVIKGGNCLLCPVGKMASPLVVRLDWALREPLSGEIDASLFLLNQDGKVASDADFIFYNQRSALEGRIRHLEAGDSDLGLAKSGFWIDLDRLPEAVERLAIGLTYHGDERQSSALAALERAGADIVDVLGNNPLARYDFTGDIQQETALIVGEIYRHAAGWKFRAVGQGFVGGLAALAPHFGVRLQDAEGDADEGEASEGVCLQTRRKRRSPAEIMAEQAQRLRKALESFLPQIRAACQSQENEARTRMILDRVFQDAFGYPMDSIKTEQNIEGRRADYVLATEDRDVLVVEVKRAGVPIRERHIFQATSYGAYAGIRWALLTNLIEWRLYRISTGDKIEANQVFSIDLKNGLDDESAHRLNLISAYGFGRKGLLDKLWLKTSALGYERLAAVLLNQEVIGKMRSILSKEAGIPLTHEEVQAAIERNLLRLD